MSFYLTRSSTIDVILSNLKPNKALVKLKKHFLDFPNQIFALTRTSNTFTPAPSRAIVDGAAKTTALLRRRYDSLASLREQIVEYSSYYTEISSC